MNDKKTVKDLYDIKNQTIIITGGGGLLGEQYAEAIAEYGATPVLWDINYEKVKKVAHNVSIKYNVDCLPFKVDVTEPKSIKAGLEKTLNNKKNINGLINNAAIDPKVEFEQDNSWSRFEYFDLNLWNRDLNVGLTGAFLCSKLIGGHMSLNGGGVIINISSDLGIISPDQRLYKKDGISDKDQFVKPVTYSVIKHGLIGLTKYLSTYWANNLIRVNTLCPGGVYNNHPAEFVNKINKLIPMNRMAEVDEYKAAIIFLLSDASSYMTGQNLVLDGGRTTW